MAKKIIKKKSRKTAKPIPGALAKRKENAVVKSSVPDYIKSEDADLNIEPGELLIPSVKLLQSTSEQVNCESPIGKNGNFFNTAIDEDIGPEVYFIPVLLNRKKIMWRNFDDGGGMICRSFDNVHGSLYSLCSECVDEKTGIPRCQFGPNGEKPVCTKYYDFVSIVFPGKPSVDEVTKIVQSIEDFTTSELSVVGFGTTKIPAARHLIKVAQAKKAALYANVFKMKSKFVEAKPNSYYIPEIAWYGWVDPDIYMAIARDIESLNALAGNPESYTKFEEEEAEVREHEEVAESESEVEDNEHFDPAAEEEDLPF